jgi:hypothetical protein
MQGGAALAVAAAVPVAVKADQAEPQADKLLDIIQRFRAEEKRMQALFDELYAKQDQLDDGAVCAREDELNAIEGRLFKRCTKAVIGLPALTAAGAIAALDLAVDWDGDTIDEHTQSLFDAVKGYLEGRVA